MARKKDKKIENDIDKISKLDEDIAALDLDEQDNEVAIIEEQTSDMIVYEPQRQDLVLYAQLEKSKTNKRGIFSLIVIAIIAVLIISIGGVIYKTMTKETELSKENFDLKSISEESLKVEDANVLYLSPYEFEGDVDLSKHFKSDTSTLVFEYYKKGDLKNKLDKISLEDVYKKRDQKYQVKIHFKTKRKYFFSNLEFDFKNVIVLQTPKGSALVSWNEYKKNQGSYTQFFEKRLREKMIINPFAPKEDPLTKDIKNWFLDSERKIPFSRQKLQEKKHNNDEKEIIIYSNNSFSNGITVSYNFISDNGNPENKHTIFCKHDALIEDDKLVEKLDKKLIYPSMKKDANGEYQETEKENAKKYYKFIGWAYKENYPEVGINAGDEFLPSNKVPNKQFQNYVIYPKFERIGATITYMDYEDIKLDNASTLGKQTEFIKLEKLDTGYGFEYSLKEELPDLGEEKYFTHWIFKDSKKVVNNTPLNIKALEFNEYNFLIYPSYQNYIFIDCDVLNKEDVVLNKVKGKKDAKFLSEVEQHIKNLSIIKEVEGYKETQNKLLGYFFKNGKKIDENTTFEDLRENFFRASLRFEKVPLKLIYQKTYYSKEKQKLITDSAYEIIERFYRADVDTIGQAVDETKADVLAQNPDFILNDLKPEIKQRKLSAYSYTIQLQLSAYFIKLEITEIGVYPNPVLVVYKDQKLPMNYTLNSNMEIVSYEIENENISFFKNDTLNQLITLENHGKKFSAKAIKAQSYSGIIKIKKVFYDEVETDINKNYYNFDVPEIIINVPLGLVQHSLLDPFKAIKEDIVEDKERFVFESFSGDWPTYNKKQSLFTLYYRRQKVNVRFRVPNQFAEEALIYYGTRMPDSLISKVKAKIGNYISGTTGKIFKGYFYNNALHTEEELRSFIIEKPATNFVDGNFYIEARFE